MFGGFGRLCSRECEGSWKGTISGLDGIGWIALAMPSLAPEPLQAAFGLISSDYCEWLGVVQSQLPACSKVLQVTLSAMTDPSAGPHRQRQWVERMLAVLPERLRHAVSRVLAPCAFPAGFIGRPFRTGLNRRLYSDPIR